MLLVVRNSNGASWPLANKVQGNKFAFLNDDVNFDKRVAAFLLVSGLILGKFCTETLKQADWQTRCETAEAENKALKETNSAQAQKIIALEAEVVTLQQLHSTGVAAW